MSSEALLQRLVRFRQMLGWAPLVIVSAIGGDYLHLALILATALAAGAVLLDFVLFKAGAIRVWPKHLDIYFFIVFGITLILAYTLPRAFVEHWLQVITQGGLTVLTVAGLLCRHPFTADIAKENVPVQHWGTPAFWRMNYLLTGIWAGIFFIMTLSYLIVALTNANGHHDNGIFIAFNYVVPLGFLFAGLMFSKWYPAHVRKARQMAEAHTQVGPNGTPKPFDGGSSDVQKPMQQEAPKL